MCQHKTACIIGCVFQCITFIFLFVLFFDIESGGYYNWGMYGGGGASWVEACRAFHILGWLTCIACIVFWALILAGIFENRVGYIVIISLTSGCLFFLFLLACIWTGESWGADAITAMCWLSFLIAVGGWVPALLIALGKTGKPKLCKDKCGSPSRGPSRRQTRTTSAPRQNQTTQTRRTSDGSRPYVTSTYRKDSNATYSKQQQKQSAPPPQPKQNYQQVPPAQTQSFNQAQNSSSSVQSPRSSKQG